VGCAESASVSGDNKVGGSPDNPPNTTAATVTVSPEAETEAIDQTSTTKVVVSNEPVTTTSIPSAVTTTVAPEPGPEPEPTTTTTTTIQTPGVTYEPTESFLTYEPQT
jgi:hypothetical protein